MSELINGRRICNGIKKELLITVSSVTLSVMAFGTVAARADEDDKPIVWIELGGQLEAMTGMQKPVDPRFFSIDAPTVDAIRKAPQFGPLFNFGNEAALSFQPEDSDWVFSGTIRFGRSSGMNHAHHQSKVGPWYQQRHTYYGAGITRFFTPSAQNTSDMMSKFSRSHVIADFQVGKDVGLGLFGRESSSNISMGVRFAQFSSKANVLIRVRPDVHYHDWTAILPNKFPISLIGNYVEDSIAARNFHGVGPSLSFKETSPLIGEANAGELALDWGFNGAVLFGRQQVRIHNHATEHYWVNVSSWHGHPQGYSTVYQNSASPPQRSRTVIVPDVGASAAITYRIHDFKVSIGYRADLFFGAMDDGIDAAKRENVNFYGPFATISIGLGG